MLIAILDLEVNVNKEKLNRIDFKFDEKPSKNKRVILEDAALPSKQTRTIWRRMRSVAQRPRIILQDFLVAC